MHKVSFLEIVQTLELCGLLCLALREAQKPIWCDLKVVYGCNAFGCFVERYFKLNFLDAEFEEVGVSVRALPCNITTVFII